MNVYAVWSWVAGEGQNLEALYFKLEDAEIVRDYFIAHAMNSILDKGIKVPYLGYTYDWNVEELEIN